METGSLWAIAQARFTLII